MNIKINTEINIVSINDLKKLKLFVEVNNLDKPNFSELGRNLGVHRRIVKKYYNEVSNNEIKQINQSPITTRKIGNVNVADRGRERLRSYLWRSLIYIVEMDFESITIAEI